ncbi:hypothetical protein HPB50_024183 [Hyalomma asiaticum]|uniref:Uncharacterized protein n=1 Tax=Hyalomma asiaticum TaxID=266040 RepID=A0ACB7SHR8_HYAAI|nr:hypothetical protein HPB50_024183 [Hyalomma asiaticum]
MSRVAHLRNVPLDTYWSVPVLAALMTLLVCMPSAYMGLVFVYIVEDYGVSRALASWPQNALFVAIHLSGLLVGALQQRISAPRIALLSSLVASMGLIASSFTKDIVLVSVTLGMIYGLGMGMFLMSVSIYNLTLFEKYKGTAMSMTFLAWGIAGLYGPVLLSQLRESYALQGALLICGGVLLHSVPLGLLLKNPPDVNFGKLKHAISNCWHRRAVKVTALPIDEPSDFVASCNAANKHSEVDATCQDPQSKSSAHSADGIDVEAEILDDRTKGEDGSLFLGTRPSDLPSRSRLDSLLELLRSPAFYVFLATTVVSEYSLVSFGTTIVDYSTDKGIELTVAAQLVMFAAVGHIIARLCIVPLSDCAKSSRLPMYACAYAVEAVSAGAMPHVGSMGAITVLRICESLGQGFIISVRNILLAQYLGIERVAASSGVFGLAMIPVSLSSPSILGLFRDTMGSYDRFYTMLAALNGTMAGLLFLFFAYDLKRRK